MNFLTNSLLFSFLIFQTLFNKTQSIKCTDHAYVAILQIENSKVESLLPEGYTLSTEFPFKNKTKTGNHIVLFELGHQINCTFSKFLSFFKTNPFEFKVEIPFVMHKNVTGPFFYKPFIFSSSELDTISFEIIYGFKSIKAEILMDGKNYDVKTKEASMNVSVDILSQNFSKIDDYENFTTFSETAGIPSFCKNFLKENRCTKNSYKWDEAKIRPIQLKGKILGNLIGEKFNNFTFETLGTNENFFGSAEMIVPLEVSLPYKC